MEPPYGPEKYYEKFFEPGDGPLIAAAGAIAVVAVWLAIWLVLYPCQRDESQWREAYLTPVMVGKIVVPIYHPAGWHRVCVER